MITNRQCLIRILWIAMCFAMVSGGLPVYAMTDVTDSTSLVQSRLRYDTVTRQSYLQVAVQNTGDITLKAPIWVAVDSLSSAAVSVAAYDGLTPEGYPYYEYTSDLEPGQTGTSATFRFDNPTRTRFRFSCLTFANMDVEMPSTVGRAVLGPLVSADVTVAAAGNSGTIIHSTQTADSADLDTAGTFSIPLERLNDETLYIISITGGDDIDADDDGVVDTTATPNLGTIHLAATGAQIKSGDFSVNILTELAYQSAAYMIQAGYPVEDVLDIMNQYLTGQIDQDIDGSDGISILDAMAWDPVTDRGLLSNDWPYYTQYTDVIHGGQSLSEITTPLQNAIISTISLENSQNLGWEWSYTVDNGFLYFISREASGQYYLEIFDSSNPAQPQSLSKTPVPWKQFTIQNDLVYGLSYEPINTYQGTRLYILDVSDKANPVSLSDGLAWEGYTPSFALSENNLIAGATSTNYDNNTTTSRIILIDVSDPTNAHVMSTSLASQSVKNIHIHNNIAYILEGPTSYNPFNEDRFCILNIIDISDPASPTTLSEYESDNYLESSMGYKENHVYLFSYKYTEPLIYDRKMLTLDVSNPEQPELVHTLNLPCRPSSSMDVSENQGYIMTKSTNNNYSVRQLVEFDLSIPSAPSLQMIMDKGMPLDVSADGSNLYVLFNVEGTTSVSYSNLKILDKNKIHPPGIMDTFFSEFVRAVTVEGTHAYIADYEGLKIVDISDPTHLEGLSAIRTDNTANDVAVSGNYAYVADGWLGISIFDIRDSTNPTLLNTLIPTIDSHYPDVPIGAVEALAVSGDLLGVCIHYEYASGSGVFIVYDISTPDQPVFQDAAGLGGYGVGLVMSGSYAYVNEVFGIISYDLSDPTNLTAGGSIYNGQFPDPEVLLEDNIAYSSGYAYAAHGNSGVLVVDVTPGAHSIATSIDINGYVYGVTATSQYLYVGSDQGVHAVDISDPLNPVVIGNIETSGITFNPFVYGENLILPCGFGGLSTIKAIRE